ncbi:hypothetical protein EIP91_002544 [Steccherinum ochraceum]|uniref:Uncharacterized protein n=1 Tax=Steccherinum ochraceum TaxID=92696 RepID=A0A4R0RIC3_9APHY|nr:hypothetical protein EIP91_002544 [Steccherinum ochraceum]
MTNPALVGMVLFAGLMVEGVVTGRLRAPEPDIDSILPTGDTIRDIYGIDDIDDELIGHQALLKVPSKEEDDGIFVVPEPPRATLSPSPPKDLCSNFMQSPAYVKPVNSEVVKAATVGRRVGWGGGQIFFNLPQTYLQYYDNAAEDSQHVVEDFQNVIASSTALVLYQPLLRFAVDARVKTEPVGIDDDITLISTQPAVGSLSSRIPDDVTALTKLALVVYRPLCVPLPIGYRKFYVTAAGVAYEIVGRPIPKRRTRRGKKKKATQLDADVENKESVGDGPKHQVKVQQLSSRPALAATSAHC